MQSSEFSTHPYRGAYHRLGLRTLVSCFSISPSVVRDVHSADIDGSSR